MLSRIVTFYSPSATFDSGAVTGLASIDSPLNLNFVYHADHYAVQAGDVLILKVPWLAPEENTTDPEYNVDHRLFDLDAAAGRGTAHFHITVKIPSGYVPEDLPKPVTGIEPVGNVSIYVQLCGPAY